MAAVVCGASCASAAKTDSYYTASVSEKKIVFQKPYEEILDVFYFGLGENPLRSLFVVPAIESQQQNGLKKTYKPFVSRVIDTPDYLLAVVYLEGAAKMADIYLKDGKSYGISATLRAPKIPTPAPAEDSEKNKAAAAQPALKTAHAEKNNSHPLHEEPPECHISDGKIELKFAEGVELVADISKLAAAKDDSEKRKAAVAKLGGGVKIREFKNEKSEVGKVEVFLPKQKEPAATFNLPNLSGLKYGLANDGKRVEISCGNVIISLDLDI